MKDPEPTTEIWGLPERSAQLISDHTDPFISTDAELEDATPSEDELAQWNDFGQFVRQALRAPSTDEDTAIPDRIGAFRVIRVLGRGGNATVYLALDPALPRLVAVKVPHWDLLRAAGTRARFLQEARLVAGLKHPHIVEIHQVGETNGKPFLVFEFCEGGSLAEWLAGRTEPLHPRTCAEIIKMLVGAVQHAHGQGILHRDLNPRNVLLVPDATLGASAPREFPFVVKLSDFGLGMLLDANPEAIHTQTGAVVGTLPYMAPEQTRGTSRFLQPTVDVHALGVMLFELLTRQRPYVGTSPVETLRLIQESAPPLPRRIRQNIPRDIETICLKCLEKSPSHRYSTAQLLADDLDRFLTHRPILAHRTSLATRTVHWLTRYPLAATLMGVICLLSGLIGVGSAWYSARLESSIQKTGELQSRSREYQDLIQDLAYAGQIRRAQELLDAGYDHAAGELLRNWIPRDQETDRRNFEWYYLVQASGGERIPLPRGADNDESLYSASPSPDGRFLYVGTEGVIEQWSVPSRSLVQRIQPPIGGGIVRDVLVDPAGDLIFTSDGVSGLFRWSMSANAERSPLCPDEPGDSHCNRVELSADGRFAASLVSQGSSFETPTSLRLHDLSTRRLVWQKTWADKRGFDLAFDHATRQIVFLTSEQLLVFNLAGAIVQESPIPIQGSPALSLAVSPNGRWLAVALDNHRLIVFRKNSERQWELAGELPIVRQDRRPDEAVAWSIERNPIAFSADNTRLFSARNAELHYWDVDRLLELQSLLNLPNSVRTLKLLSDGQTVAWGSSVEMGLWRPQARLPQIAGHSKETWSVCFSPDGRLMATGSDDETVKIWDVKTGTELHTLSGHVATVSAVAFSPDLRYVASGSLDCTIRIWDLLKPGEVKTLSGHPGTVRCLDWSRDGRLLISGDHIRNGTPTVIVWDVAEGRQLQHWTDHRNRLHETLFMKDGRRCVTVSEDTTATVRDVRTGHIELTLHDTQQLLSGVLLNDGRWLAAGTKYGIIRIWDLDSGKLVKDLRGHAVSVRSVAISPDGKVLASGSEDSTVRLWDPQSGECLLVLRGHQAPVNGVAFSPNGEILASGAHDGTVKLWHAPRPKTP